MSDTEKSPLDAETFEVRVKLPGTMGYQIHELPRGRTMRLSWTL